MNKRKLDDNYIQDFFGDTSILSKLTNSTEIKREIAKLRRQWIRCGDYTPGVDPTARAIFAYVYALSLLGDKINMEVVH